MLPTTPSFIASICNSSGVQCEKGKSNFPGSSHDMAIIAATCSSLNVGGLPGLGESDKTNSMEARILCGVSASIRLISVLIPRYLSRHFCTVPCRRFIAILIALLLNPCEAIKIILERVFRCSGVCVPDDIWLNIATSFSLASILSADFHGIFIKTFLFPFYTFFLPFSAFLFIAYLRQAALDEATGAIVQTDGRMKGEKAAKAPAKAWDPPKYIRLFYGATYLLDAIGEKLGLAEDLRQCFPEMHKEILSLAYYLILEDNGALYRFEKWGQTHKHPCGEDIPSPRSSEIFAAIGEDAMHQFFRLQGRRRMENEYWAYDITTISSYSECLRQIQYGHDKDGDGLPQLKLALVFGEQSRLPFYYRKMAGNILDLMTVKALLSEFDVFGFKKVKLIMDRGFYKEGNINGLLKDRLKFLVAVKMSLKFVKSELDKVYDSFRTFEYYNEDYELYSTAVPYEWPYSQVRPYKGDVLKEKRRVYIHFYYSIDRAAEDQKNFDRRLMALKNEIVSEKRVPGHEKSYKKYFDVKSMPIRGIRVNVKEDAVMEAKRYYGFFALMSNDKMDPMAALMLYRNKDLVEKAFGNLKERLNFRRTLVSSEQTLNGKLFVEFVALIYLSYINKQMHDANLYKHHTLAGLLDKLDVIECFEHPGRRLQVGEIIDKQRDLYAALDIEPPSSL